MRGVKVNLRDFHECMHNSIHVYSIRFDVYCVCDILTTTQLSHSKQVQLFVFACVVV